MKLGGYFSSRHSIKLKNNTKYKMDAKHLILVSFIQWSVSYWPHMKVSQLGYEDWIMILQINCHLVIFLSYYFCLKTSSFNIHYKFLQSTQTSILESLFQSFTDRICTRIDHSIVLNNVVKMGLLSNIPSLFVYTCFLKLK